MVPVVSRSPLLFLRFHVRRSECLRRGTNVLGEGPRVELGPSGGDLTNGGNLEVGDAP